MKMQHGDNGAGFSNRKTQETGTGPALGATLEADPAQEHFSEQWLKINVKVKAVGRKCLPGLVKGWIRRQERQKLDFLQDLKNFFNKQ